MDKITVIAAQGLRVPTEHNPHEYIGSDAPAEVADSLYYRRLIADGDLLAVSPSKPEKPAAKGKGA